MLDVNFWAQCGGTPCNPNTQEAEEVILPQVQGLPGIHTKFQARYSNVVRSYLKRLYVISKITSSEGGQKDLST